MCDVFFLGTARRTDSQMSSRKDEMEGKAIEKAGRYGMAAICRANRDAARDVRNGINELDTRVDVRVADTAADAEAVIFGADSRGRRAAAEKVVRRGIVAMLKEQRTMLG